MKHCSKSLIILILLSCFLFYSCPKAPPTVPIQPKPRANISIGVSTQPVLFICILGICVANFYVTVSEGNGVGATISTIKGAFISGTSLVGEHTVQGGSLSASGSIQIKFQMITTTSYSKIRVTVTGQDFNGYSISKSADFSTSFLWTSN